ncbi:MAG: hypothetical protein WD335_03645 [Candidatus Paceibacterota bacterium]
MINKKEFPDYISNHLRDFTENPKYTLIGKLNNADSFENASTFIFDENNSMYFTLFTVINKGDHFEERIDEVEKQIEDKVRELYTGGYTKYLEEPDDELKTIPINFVEPLDQEEVERFFRADSLRKFIYSYWAQELYAKKRGFWVLIYTSAFWIFIIIIIIIIFS